MSYRKYIFYMQGIDYVSYVILFLVIVESKRIFS
jgi:hypothetical protein